MTPYLFSIKLLDLVYEYKELYDVSHKLFYDQRHREIIWRMIAAELHAPESACKTRWVSLRDQFFKFNRKHKNENKKKFRYHDEMIRFLPYHKARNKKASQNGRDETKTETVDLPEEIEIAIENIVHFVKYEDDDDDDNDNEIDDNSNDNKDFTEERRNEDDEDAVFPTTSGRSNLSNRNFRSKCCKVKLENLDEDEIESSNKRQKVDDPIDSFFRTIATTVKSLTPIRQHQAKNRIFDVVSKLEFEQLEENEQD